MAGPPAKQAGASWTVRTHALHGGVSILGTFVVFVAVIAVDGVPLERIRFVGPVQA